MTHHSADLPTAPVSARDPRRAAIAAAIVAAVMLLGLVLTQFQTLGWLRDVDYLRDVMLPFLRGIFVDLLGFAGGVFLLLWLWPVRRDDRVLRVLAKGAAAAAAGVLLAIVLGLLVNFVAVGAPSVGDLRYYSWPAPFVNLLSMFVARAPLVMLVVLVQWVLDRAPRG